MSIVFNNADLPWRVPVLVLTTDGHGLGRLPSVGWGRICSPPSRWFCPLGKRGSGDEG